MEKIKEPKIFIILKLLSIAMFIGGVVATIVLYILEPSIIFIGIIVFVVSLPLLYVAFIPQIKRTVVKTKRYIQQSNKEDLTDINNASADIVSGAITKTVRSIKKGLKDTKFCKYCGVEIDADSNYCSKCGGKQ